MQARRLKVYKSTTKDYVPIPRISLQGQWLEELGFSIGDRLTIVSRQDELIIAKANGKINVRKDKEDVNGKFTRVYS